MTDPAEIKAWEPTWCLADDLAHLAHLAAVAEACQAVIDEWSPQFAKLMTEKKTGPATVDTPAGPVTRKWRSAGYEWDSTADVLELVADYAGMTREARRVLEDVLPAKLHWRVGDPEEGKPGLRCIGLDPDSYELRHKKSGGRWVLDFSAVAS